MAKDSSRDWELLYLFKGGRLLQRESSKLIMLSFLWPDPRVRHFLCDPETCKPHRCRTTRSGGCDYLGTSHVYFYTGPLTNLRNRRVKPSWPPEPTPRNGEGSGAYKINFVD
jgi:hypothetical protein